MGVCSKREESVDGNDSGRDDNVLVEKTEKSVRNDAGGKRSFSWILKRSEKPGVYQNEGW